MPASRIKTALFVWGIAEILTFVVVDHLVGTAWTIVAIVASSLFGMALLRRTGAATLVQLRASFRSRLSGSPVERNDDLIDSGLRVLGALALVVPGFLSDLVGLALLLRPLRDRIAKFVVKRRWVAVVRTRSFEAQSAGPRSGATGADIVDLDRNQWHDGDQPNPTPARR